MIAVHDPNIYFGKDILSHFAQVSHFSPGYAIFWFGVTKTKSIATF